MIQITDFRVNGFVELECHDGAEVDIGGDTRGFIRIVSELVFGISTERGESADVKGVESFRDILTILNFHNFKIMEGFDIVHFYFCEMDSIVGEVNGVSEIAQSFCSLFLMRLRRIFGMEIENRIFVSPPPCRRPRSPAAPASARRPRCPSPAAPTPFGGRRTAG
jgi:hypothetical protein